MTTWTMEGAVPKPSRLELFEHSYFILHHLNLHNVQCVSDYKLVATCPGIISMSSTFVNYVLSYVNTEWIQCQVKYSFSAFAHL